MRNALEAFRIIFLGYPNDMPRIDFKEIPQGNIADGKQDTFELFAREFLETLGYEIISEPSRGSDGEKDLIVLETRVGVGGKTFIRWLVSCKHNAHSGKSVTPKEETNFLDRLKQHNCSGYIGFYSTLPSSKLSERLEGIRNNDSSFEFQIFNNEMIETRMLSNPEFQILLKKYFPMSYEQLELSNLGLSLAIARIGMPQPVLYKFPDEEETLTVEEVTKLYPQGNNYAFSAWTGDFIFFNNLFGITKIRKENGFVFPAKNELEEMDKRAKLSFEATIRHLEAERKTEEKTNDTSD